MALLHGIGASLVGDNWLLLVFDERVKCYFLFLRVFLFVFVFVIIFVFVFGCELAITWQ